MKDGVGEARHNQGKMCADAAEKAGRIPKASPHFRSWHAESYLIKGERELAGTDGMGAPPSGNYMGPCCHLNLQGHFNDHKVEAARKASLQVLLVERHIYSHSKGAE